MAKAETKAVPLFAYDVVRKPIVTEKSTNASAHNQVVFEVATDATKPQIKAAVEALFKVKVDGVNTLNCRGKKKIFRGRLGQRAGWKKAIVTLADGQSIDLATSV